MESRVVRLRPILLTAGDGHARRPCPITLDPIFSGLAWSLIFGLFASTVFTLFVIPVSLLAALRQQARPRAAAVRGLEPHAPSRRERAVRVSDELAAGRVEAGCVPLPAGWLAHPGGPGDVAGTAKVSDC